jgi:uncharacterized protein (TIGR03437 family)
MHLSIRMNQAQKRQWNRAVTLGFAAIASFLLPVLCPAQTPPVFTVTTVAGSGPPASAGYGGDGFAALSANLNGPASVAFDSKGNMYIADQVNNVIRMVTASTGNISTVAGNNSAGYTGDGKTAVSAQINIPDSIVFDSKGNYYISDYNNHVVRMVNTSGIISTFAGSQSEGSGYSGDGAAATAAALGYPTGIAFDSSGNMYISDYGTFSDFNKVGNDRIREVLASNGYISTIAGTGNVGYLPPGGPALSTNLNGVNQIAVDTFGNLYLADSFNNIVRKIVLSTGTMSIVAGAPNVYGYTGDEGQAVNALLNNPTGVAVDSAGNVYICDTYNDVIRMVTPDGIIHTIAGTGPPIPGSTSSYSGDGGPALSAQFNEPYSITIDSSGNLYIADYANNVIRKLVPSSGPGSGAKAPSIRTASGVISASDFGALAAVGPGSWIEIYGTNLASTTREWGASDFTGINNATAPTQLSNTTVSIGGQSAFVEFISPTQVNAQVPSTVGLGSQPVVVSTTAGPSAAFNIIVNLEQPALFAPAEFKPYVGALFPDLTTYVLPTGEFSGIASRAAKPGDTIVFYGIGFAQVPGSPAGTVPQVANGLSLAIQPKFYFNSVQAQVSYAGLAPQSATTGYIGLYQFNVIVPTIPGLSSAPMNVPVTFTVNENGTDVAGTQTLYTSVAQN